MTPGISQHTSQFFVGRAAELALLAEALNSALAGRGSLMVISGEAGIGKSALIEEHLRHAERLGVLTVSSRCFETEAAPPYGPWLQLLQRLARAGYPPAQALLKRWQAGSRGAVGLDRFQLFDLIASHLVESATESGLVLVLEDLQWADMSSLVLLRHLCDDVVHARLQFVCSYRDDVGTDATRSSILQALHRLHGAHGLVLAPLQETEVTSFAGQLDAAGRADFLKRTGGNPFYMTELARVLSAGGDLRRIPPGVHGLIEGRLSQLPDSVIDLLGTAAVIGSEFGLNRLARSGGTSADRAANMLGAAAAAGIVTGVSGRQGDFRFSQELVREVLYQNLMPSVRAEKHRRVAMAIEYLFAPELDSHLAELSFHWIRASAEGGSDEPAAEWTLRAAEHAVKRLAYEEGVRLYQAALQLTLAETRANVLLRLARAQYQAGEVQPAYETCGEIAEIARSAKQPELLAEAASVLQGIGDFDLAPELAAMCDEALASLPAEDTPLRARLLGQLASQLAYVPDYERTIEVSAQALEVAGRTGDTDALVFALRSRQLALSGPQWVPERLALAGRMVGVGSSTRQPSVTFWGRLWRIDALLQLGDLAGVDAEQALLERLVDNLQLPIARWHLVRLEAARAALRGEFGAALALGEEAWDLGRRGGHQAALHPWMAFRVLVALETGDLSTVEEIVARWPRGLRFPVLKAGMARNLLALGRDAEARALFDSGAAQLTTHPMDYQWLPSAAVLSDLACRFEARDVANMVYPRLLQFSTHLVVPGAGPPIAIDGSVALRLGMLARLLGHEEAPHHFEEAIAIHDRLSARPYSARSRLEYARYLAAAGRRREAHRLARSAMLIARELGMKPLAGQAEALVEALSDKAEGERLSRREAEIAAQVAKGLTNRQIATALFLSERTVEAHLQNILGKLGFRNRSQVAAWAVQRARED